MNDSHHNNDIQLTCKLLRAQPNERMEYIMTYWHLVCASVFCYLLTSIVQLIAAIWMSARIVFIVISVCAVFP